MKNCREQAYDGASAIAEAATKGVLKEKVFLEEFPETCNFIEKRL